MPKYQNIAAKAYVVSSRGSPFVLQDIILDGVHEKEVLVEIKYTGICHTDIVVRDGDMPIGGYPAVLGHERVGVIREVGPGVQNKSLLPGDIVLLSFHTCGQCRPWEEGRLGGCLHMTKFFGQSSMSKLAIVAEKSVVKIDAQPKDLQYLAPFSSGYLTGAGTILNVLKPHPTEKIAVLGLGAVGLAALEAAKAIGVETLIAVDLFDSKLQRVVSVGATHTINSKEFMDINAGIRSMFPDGVDKIVDTTSVASLLNSSFKVLAHEETLALVGVPFPSALLQVEALDVLLSCKKIVGVIEGLSDPRTINSKLINLYHEKKFPIDKLSTVYPTEDLDRAIADLKSGSVSHSLVYSASPFHVHLYQCQH
ncbi:chaperonin 10-like protein [Aspergillus floccosus]